MLEVTFSGRVLSVREFTGKNPPHKVFQKVVVTTPGRNDTTRRINWTNFNCDKVSVQENDIIVVRGADPQADCFVPKDSTEPKATLNIVGGYAEVQSRSAAAEAVAPTEGFPQPSVDEYDPLG